MKLPVSQLKSQDLESLFQKSSIMERYFFPRKVPAPPDFLSLDKGTSLENIKNPHFENEGSLQKKFEKENFKRPIRKK